MRYIAASFFIFILSLVGITKPIENVLVSVLTPIQFGMRSSARDLKNTNAFFLSAGDIHKENLDLHTKILMLETEMVGLKQSITNSEIYKDQNQFFTAASPDSKLEQVLIMGNVFDTSNATVIINKGSKHKIKVNDPVVVGKNLLGVTRTVDRSRSIVELLTSPNLSFTVYDLDSAQKTQGLLKGKYGFTLSMERILQSEDIKVGDTILTSGKDGHILPGFIVGKVSKVISDPSQPLKSAEVISNINFAKVYNAFVVITEE